MGGNGFVGVAPDYIHMSEWSSPGHQAFIHARTEANCTIDLFRAVRQYCAAHNVGLSGQVFITGYSQGGNSTVATAKMIQENHPAEFNIMAAAAGGGSYDLSGVCADSLTSTNRVTPERHSLPLVIRSLAIVYQDSLTAWGTGITPANVIDTVFKSPYREQLPALLDRFDPMGDNSFLDSIPARMINDNYLLGFQSDPNHFFRKLLADNDIDDWAPQMPLVLFHSNIDIENPYQNAVNTLAKFQQNGAPDVSLNTVANLTHPAAGQPFVLFALNMMKSKRIDCKSAALEENQNNSSIALNLYPNPTSDLLNVELGGIDTKDYTTVKLFNMNLQLVLQSEFSQQTSLNISHLNAGTYLLSIESANGNKLFKMFCKSQSASK